MDNNLQRKTKEEYLKELEEAYLRRKEEINNNYDENLDEFEDNIEDTVEDEFGDEIEDSMVSNEEEGESLDTEFEKAEQPQQPKKESKWRVVLIYIFMFLLPIFVSLSIISLHTTYLVRKPFNYVCMCLGGALAIAIIILFIVQMVKRDKTKKIKKFVIANLIMGVLLTGIDIILLYFFVKKRAWNLLNIFIAHYKILLIGIFIFMILIILLLLLIKIKKRKIKRNIKILFLNFVVCIYVLGCIDGMLVIYRSSAFKEWLITTAMQTMHHQYFCKWFYSAKEIDEIMSQNYVLESGESTNPDLIDKEKTVTYANEYERAILEHDKDASYKIINLDVNGCKGYLAAVYDPTTVHLLVTANVGVYGQYVTTMAKNNNAVLAINGGGFYDPGNTSTGGSPTGITISDGKVITRGEYGMQTQSGGIIGFDKNGILYLLKDLSVQNAVNIGIQNAVTWGPFLIVNGERSFIKGNGGWGYAARTAIGQRKDGIVLFLVVDSNASRTNGADMVDLTDIMENYGAINAANLDGGTSSVMVENGELINDPIDGALRHQTRAIADSFAVIEK